jgi:hypothetical protein
MTTSPLSPIEIIAYLAARIERFERLGLTRENAIRAVALDDGLDEKEVKAILAAES